MDLAVKLIRQLHRKRLRSIDGFGARSKPQDSLSLSLTYIHIHTLALSLYQRPSQRFLGFGGARLCKKVDRHPGLVGQKLRTEVVADQQPPK